MIDRENNTTREKVKKVLYGVCLVVATLGGERAVLYVRDKYGEHKEREAEDLAERIVRKYKKETGLNPG